MNAFELIDKLEKERFLDRDEWIYLIKNRNQKLADYLFEKAVRVRKKYYAKDVYLRGLIEFTNYCKNDCYYCGIRRSNKNAERYRLSKEQILKCCSTGYELGFRTFVLQGGEDPYFTEERMTDIISAIKSLYDDCALTLSVGEHPRQTYKTWFDAGADRYLLRHETADEGHYKILHPESMSFENRRRCIRDLKETGFQTGCGLMVGSPGQTAECIAKDMEFLKEISPDMIGIGPFIPQKDTPFKEQKPGTLELTLFLLGLIRLMLPMVLLPATTALGTIHPMGREMGIMAGANVCMPNLSTVSVRKKYSLYDNKISTGDEAAESIKSIVSRLETIGYNAVVSRGDRFGFYYSKER